MSSSRTETTVEVTMPQMGVSVAEGTITDWVKRPGDWVEADEIVCIVTTDKVDVEIPAPASGRLERVLVEVDQTVPVGRPCRDRSGGEARSGPSAGGIERGRRGARTGPGYGHGAGATPRG